MIEITQIGDPLLRKKAQPVEKIDSSILELIEQLKKAIAAYPNTIALAAPQLGLSTALFVACFPDDREKPNPYRVFINSKIKEPSKETWVEKEASLSVPEICISIRRPTEITISYQDEHGIHHTERLKGWPARIVMHENDLLNGKLFIDRVEGKEKAQIAKKLRS